MTNDLTTAPDVSALFRREWEELEPAHVRFAPWQRCQHGKQIVHVMAHWSDAAPFTVTTGQRNSSQRFEVTRHADGSAEWGEPFRGKPQLAYEYNTVSRCANCHGLNTLDRVQEAWGDRVTCTACGDSHFYSIGD